MYDIISIKDRIIRLLISERTMINALLGLLGLLVSLGYLLGDTSTTYYTTISGLVHVRLWAAAFMLYGILKIHGCLYRTPVLVKTVSSVYGLWLWTYLVLSYTIFDVSNIRPLEYMLFATILYELWALVIIIYYHLHPLYRRLRDAPF